MHGQAHGSQSWVAAIRAFGPLGAGASGKTPATRMALQMRQSAGNCQAVSIAHTERQYTLQPKEALPRWHDAAHPRDAGIHRANDDASAEAAGQLDAFLLRTCTDWRTPHTRSWGVLTSASKRSGRRPRSPVSVSCVLIANCYGATRAEGAQMYCLSGRHPALSKLSGPVDYLRWFIQRSNSF